MAGIDNLKNRILDDDRSKSQVIETEGKNKAKEIIDAAKVKAQKLMDDMKEKAEKDGMERKERIISRAQLDARNNILASKQQAIDNVLDKVVEYVSSMDDKKYREFIEKLLLNSVENGDEEVVFSSKDREKLGNDVVVKVNDELAAQGKKGMLTLSSETRNIPSGFILKMGGLEVNCSIDSQIRVIRDSLEGEIANLLFQGR